MEYKLVLSNWLLLLLTLTAFVSSDDDIEVIDESNGIKLKCTRGNVIPKRNNSTKELKLEYLDENTGEYYCGEEESQEVPKTKIFVKFRTCDNCVELDLASVVGMVIGDIVATIMVGVGVYLAASQTRTGLVVPNKKSKSSDKQHLVPQPTDSQYQPLRYRSEQPYDQLLHRA
ncbi:T-cell surface glycoprotein CD3 delta chain isoform 2-T2 [Pholidichthys leucotaenia]